ncbi:MAG: hypothetical protein ACKOXT_03965 [Actinomycetota bacterium]
MQIRLRPVLLSLLLLVVVGGVISYFQPKDIPKSSVTVENFAQDECQQDGVTLVVDFGTNNKTETLVRCAIDFSGSGWELFKATGIEAEGTASYPIGFVCRIAGYPTELNQDCQDTPKYSEGSWGYYQLNEQGKWQVSGVGSAFSKPKCGLAEGWRFIEPGEDVADLAPRIIPEVRVCSD